jgi:hypothetical protein
MIVLQLCSIDTILVQSDLRNILFFIFFRRKWPSIFLQSGFIFFIFYFKKKKKKKYHIGKVK